MNFNHKIVGVNRVKFAAPRGSLTKFLPLIFGAVLIFSLPFFETKNLFAATSVPKIDCHESILGCDQAATNKIKKHWIVRLGIPAWIETVILFSAGFAVLSIMFGGGMMMFSFGKEDAFDKGSKIITFAVLGLVLAMFSWAIVKIIENISFPYLE
jgi:hypothetical protein